jgi:Na+/proline symporter
VANTEPIGHQRGIIFGIVLFIITLGFYGLYWMYVTFDEMKRHTGTGIGGGLAIVLWLLGIIFVVPAIALDFIAPHEVGQMYERDGKKRPVSGWTGLWLFPFGLLIIPAFVWWVKVQGSLNRYWAEKEVGTAAVQAASA